MTLNLKDPDGRAAFLRLVEQADVVVENYRPDVKSRLGIDYPACRAVNPRIVYASVSGFGQEGPYRMRPGFDQIAQGMGGLMWITGLPGQGPVRVGVPIADLASGLYASIGIFIALLEREETGEGRWVHSSLLEAQIAMLDFQAARWTVAGEVPPQAGNNHPTSIPTGVFETADGFINIASSGARMWRRLCGVLDDADMRDDPRYATEEARSDNREDLNERIQAHTRKRTSAEWIDALNDAGVPCGPIYRMNEMWADPQVEHLGMQRPTRHPGARRGQRRAQRGEHRGRAADALPPYRGPGRAHGSGSRRVRFQRRRDCGHANEERHMNAPATALPVSTEKIHRREGGGGRLPPAQSAGEAQCHSPMRCGWGSPRS